MLVPMARLEEAGAIAGDVAAKIIVGDPNDAATTMGPVANRRQWERVQSLIERGLADGARLAAGGPGRPAGLDRGFFVRPDVFSMSRTT